MQDAIYFIQPKRIRIKSVVIYSMVYNGFCGSFKRFSLEFVSFFFFVCFFSVIYRILYRMVICTDLNGRAYLMTMMIWAQLFKTKDVVS